MFVYNTNLLLLNLLLYSLLEHAVSGALCTVSDRCDVDGYRIGLLKIMSEWWTEDRCVVLSFYSKAIFSASILWPCLSSASLRCSLRCSFRSSVVSSSEFWKCLVAWHTACDVPGAHGDIAMLAVGACVRHVSVAYRLCNENAVHWWKCTAWWGWAEWNGGTW